MNKFFKFVTVFVLLALGPIIFNLVSVFITIENISQKDKNLIGLIGTLAYFIGVIATLLFVFLSKRGIRSK